MMTILRAAFRIAPWLAIFVFVSAEMFVDPGYWITVSRVMVKNSVVDVSPSMIVAREVHRPFHGAWTATVKNVDGTLACIANGQSDYHPETRLPASINLDWWTFPTRCDLMPGNYTVFTSWRWRVLWLDRETSMLSNIFSVKPKNEDAGG